MSYDGIPVREVETIPPDGEVNWLVSWGTAAPDTSDNRTMSWGTPPRARWGRLVARVRVWLDRCRDAWSVLRGEAEAVRWDDLS